MGTHICIESLMGLLAFLMKRALSPCLSKQWQPLTLLTGHATEQKAIGEVGVTHANASLRQEI